MAAMYGLLWVVGWAIRPSTYSLATLAPHAGEIELITSRRSGEALPETFNDHMAEALSLLQTATRSTLGLFPRYDKDSVLTTLGHLQQAQTLAHNPDQQAEATFYLAKAHLMLEQASEARQALGRVAQVGTSSYTKPAQALLQKLEQP